MTASQCSSLTLCISVTIDESSGMSTLANEPSEYMAGHMTDHRKPELPNSSEVSAVRKNKSFRNTATRTTHEQRPIRSISGGSITDPITPYE